MKAAVENRHYLILFLAVITLTSAVVSVLLKSNLDSERDELSAESREAAVRAVSKTVFNINKKIEGLRIANEIAGELTSGTLKFDKIDDRLLSALKTGDDIALTVAWKPEFKPDEFTFVNDADIYFMTAHKFSGKPVVKHDRVYTKSMLQNQKKGKPDSWYEETFQEEEETWVASPYHSPSSEKWWACGYSVPFRVNGEIVGVVAAELTAELANLTVYHAEEKPSDSSYGMLVSRSGVIFSHPDLEVVKEHLNLDEFIQGMENPATIPDEHHVVEDVTDLASESPIYELIDFKFERTGQMLSLYFSPIGETGWWAVVVLDKQATDESAETRLWLKTMKTRILLTALLAVFGVVAIVLRVDRPNGAKLWTVASVFSILCLVAVAWILCQSFDTRLNAHPDDTLLKNRAVAAKEMMHYKETHGGFPISIPTGIFVQSAEFSSANNVTVTGFIWQRFDEAMMEKKCLQGDPKDAEPGFFLPEAEESSIAFSYRRPDGATCVYGWTFHAVLRQEFDYHKFPFDTEEIWVRLWPNDWGKDLVLSPDLKSYTTLVPGELPGLELQDFVLEGWKVVSTYFSYRHNDYNTNFGSTDFKNLTQIPELYFNIGLNRVFLNAFIMNFITLTVVAFLLFAVLYTIRTSARDAELLGFNVAAVLGFCAALFFVVIVAHTSLRESLAAQSLVYLEYYFFAMYIAFLGVSINAIMVASRTRYPLIDYGDNLVARLLYWPLLTFTILCVTLVTFN